MTKTTATELILADLRQLAYERRTGQVECPGGNHQDIGDYCPFCGAAP